LLKSPKTENRDKLFQQKNNNKLSAAQKIFIFGG